MNENQLRTALNLGKVGQIGCVVRSVSDAVKNYEEVIGIGPFAIFDFKPEKTFIKDRRSDDMLLKIGVAQLSPDLSLELIEVVTGESYHKDFLTKHGDGIQHLGFLTNDYDGVLARAKSLDIAVLMWAETDVPGMGHIRAAYLDTHDHVGFLCEVIEIT